MPPLRYTRLFAQFFLLLLMCATGATVVQGQSMGNDMMLQVGEELEYEVSYLLFNLGTIRVQVVEREESSHGIVYRARAYIDSNPSLSWLIELHAVFESLVDDDMYSHMWISDERRPDGSTYRRRFLFEYERNRVIIERGTIGTKNDTTIERIDTVAITAKCQDGLSLYYYARENVRQKKQDNIPTLIERDQVNTFIDFQNRIVPVEIDSLEHELEAVEFEGRADFVGLAGLTGGFRGWFSNDGARVPLLARMNVIVGSVKIELVRWKRAGWEPPAYQRR